MGHRQALLLLVAPEAVELDRVALEAAGLDRVAPAPAPALALAPALEPEVAARAVQVLAALEPVALERVVPVVVVLGPVQVLVTRATASARLATLAITAMRPPFLLRMIFTSPVVARSMTFLVITKRR
jgi:hypothetical protein